MQTMRRLRHVHDWFAYVEAAGDDDALNQECSEPIVGGLYADRYLYATKLGTPSVIIGYVPHGPPIPDVENMGNP